LKIAADFPSFIFLTLPKSVIIGSSCTKMRPTLGLNLRYGRVCAVACHILVLGFFGLPLDRHTLLGLPQGSAHTRLPVQRNGLMAVEGNRLFVTKPGEEDMKSSLYSPIFALPAYLCRYYNNPCNGRIVIILQGSPVSGIHLVTLFQALCTAFDEVIEIGLNWLNGVTIISSGKGWGKNLSHMPQSKATTYVPKESLTRDREYMPSATL